MTHHCPHCKDGDAPPDHRHGPVWACLYCLRKFIWMGDE